MAPIRATLRAKAKNVSRFLGNRAKTIYEDECMKLESHYRGVKDAVDGTAPYIVATGLAKVVGSFRRTQFANPKAVVPLAKATHHADDRGRIDKQKRFNFPEMGKMEEEARAIYAKRQHQKLLAQQRQAEEDRELAKQEDAFRKSSRRCPPPPPTPPPELTQTSDMRPHNPDMTDAENRKFIQEKLTSILGEERMRVPCLLPSGHSGIDPVIAEYNLNKATRDMLDQFDAWKAEEHRKVEEQQRQAAQEEANRLKIQILLDYHRARYEERVEDLAQFATPLSEGIDMLEFALLNNNMDEAAMVVQNMTAEILEPAYVIFKEMDKEIPLEERGAEELKAVWPLERLSQLHTFLLNEGSLPAELIYMGQGIEAICKPILYPTPFENPLDPKPVPVLGFNQTCTGGATSTNFMSNPIMGNPIEVRPSSGPTPVPADELAPAPVDGGRSFSSFADAIASNKAAAQDAQQVPGITVTAPSGSEKQAIMDHMAKTLFELQMSVDEIKKGDGIPSNPRRELTEFLQKLVDLANGQQKILGPGEGDVYKLQIQRIQRRIANLGKTAKKAPKTRQLDVVVNQALKLWVADM